jgi:FkbM family methyltransferase
VPLLRKNTFDSAIWTSVHYEYPTLPSSFEAGEVMLDIGCHTGAVCHVAARRGATVVGYEANHENYALAVINLQGLPSVTVRHAAVWRSDSTTSDPLIFTPSADPRNTGGGSVVFETAEDHWSARPAEDTEPGAPSRALSIHEVDAVALDDILVGLGSVRYCKLDVEGAEFPILLTATRLDLVTAIGGEYHEFSDEQMACLAPGARVGDERYSADLLRRCLMKAGFDDVRSSPACLGRGSFAARRVAAAR